MRRLSVPVISSLVALLTLVLVAPELGPAEGAIPNDGTYSACLTKGTGEFDIINYPKVKCGKGERLIRWSQQGPSGAPGPQGAQGPKGDQGPAGPADWNAIANKPAGFADGIDNGGFTSTTFSEVHSLASGADKYVWAESAIGTDTELTIIPLGPFENVQITEELYETGPSGAELKHFYRISTYGTGAVQFKVRARIYNVGISPAAFRKAGKAIKVGVSTKGPRQRR